MHPNNHYFAHIFLTVVFQDTLALFAPRAEDLVYPDNPAAILPEHRNYGLFDRPAPPLLEILNSDQHDLKKRIDPGPILSVVSALETATQPPSPTSMASLATSFASATTTTTPDGAYATGSPTEALSDTYYLPSYNPSQLSSIAAAESSAFGAQSSLLSAFSPGSSGIACMGVKDVNGAEVTVCGLTENPSPTAVGGKSDGENTGVSWGFAALGGIGALVAFLV